MNIIISDLHLGSNKCNIAALTDFLKYIDGSFDKLILNGDILDISRLNDRWYLPESHLNVLNYFQRLYEKDKLIYLRGNHEEKLKYLGSIKLKDRYQYISKGKIITLLHGHQLNKIKYPGFLEKFLDELYYKYPNNFILVKLRKLSINYMNRLPELASKLYNKSHFICIGHTHEPGFSFFDNVVVNSGDFVRSLTYLIESEGSITLKYFN